MLKIKYYFLEGENNYYYPRKTKIFNYSLKIRKKNYWKRKVITSLKEKNLSSMMIMEKILVRQNYYFKRKCLK